VFFNDGRDVKRRRPVAGGRELDRVGTRALIAAALLCKLRRRSEDVEMERQREHREQHERGGEVLRGVWGF